MFDTRSVKLELMDQPEFGECPAESSYRFIEMINSLYGGTRVAKNFIEGEAADMPADKTLRVLDIGSGTCDIPLSVCRWARKQRINVHITCVESNGYVVDMARRKLKHANETGITVIQEDIFDYRPDRPFDCAVGSMMFHHLGDEAILRLINRLREFVHTSLLINDLLRCLLSYTSCALLVIGSPHVVRHDALLSIRKGFRKREMVDLLSRLEGVSVSVNTRFFFRIEAVVRFFSGGAA